MKRAGVLGFLLALGACPPAKGPMSAARLAPCRVPGVDEEVRCGTYEVHEDRARGQGRSIALEIVVLPATGADAVADPLVFLAGGGVAPATRYAPFLAKAFPKLRRQRDILLVDQRGTGGSNALDCDLSTDPANPAYRDEARFVSDVRACRAALERRADLRAYTTPIAMDDLDEVRASLGYSRLNLYGASYGTTAAMVYVRQHPEHVRAVALQGVVPVDVPMWLEVARSSQDALDETFAACARQPACRAAFPDAAAELASLLKRLADEPVVIGGVTIDDLIVRDFVFRALYSVARARVLPLLVHLAVRGEYRPLAARLAARGDSGIPKGVYLSIVCNEVIPLFDPEALPSAASGTFLGTRKVGREIRACREWPRAALPPGFWAPVRSDVPALVMNGARDSLTPPRYGEHVAWSLANARQLVLPERAHDDVDACVTGVVEAFLLAGDAKGLDTSCLAKTPETSFALTPGELD